MELFIALHLGGHRRAASSNPERASWPGTPRFRGLEQVIDAGFLLISQCLIHPNTLVIKTLQERLHHFLLSYFYASVLCVKPDFVALRRRERSQLRFWVHIGLSSRRVAAVGTRGRSQLDARGQRADPGAATGERPKGRRAHHA